MVCGGPHGQYNIIAVLEVFMEQTDAYAVRLILTVVDGDNKK